MRNGWGKNRRLQKLKKDNYFLILAMDHAITNGPISGINTVDNVNKWVSFSEKNNIPAVVLNYQYIYNLDVFQNTNIVVQTMGLVKHKKMINKVPLTNVEDVNLIDGTAVSIQINFDAEDLDVAMQEISQIVSKANQNQYPVLFMVGNDDWESAEDFTYAVRVCAELGADLIKIHLPSKVEEIKKIQSYGKNEPALLLAGGESMENFDERLQTAKGLGFQGICLGRNIFQSQAPIETLKTIEKVFKNI